MKDIQRSRRFRISHQRCRPSKSPLNTTDDDNESEHFRQKTIARNNQNANRTATILSLDQQLPSSSEHSSLFIYSLNSRQKFPTQSDDLTPLSLTISNTTPLTPLTCSNTKQTVKIDLTDLSVTDTFDSSHEQTISFNRQQNLTSFYDTDTSVTSNIFSNENLSITNIDNNDRTAIEPTKDTRINLAEQLSSKWNLPPMTDKMKLLISCVSLVFIASVLFLTIIF